MSRPNEVHSLCFDLVLPTLPRSIDEDHHPPEDQPASADPRCDGTPLLEDIAQPRRAREIQVRCAVHGKRRSRRNMVELVEGSGRWSCVEGRQCQLKHRSTVAETGNIFTEPKEPQETVSHTDSIYQHALQQQQQQHTFQQQQSFQFHQQAQQHFALHQNEVLASAPFFQSVPLVIHQQHHDQQPHDFHSGFMAAASGVGIQLVPVFFPQPHHQGYIGPPLGPFVPSSFGPQMLPFPAQATGYQSQQHQNNFQLIAPPFARM